MATLTASLVLRNTKGEPLTFVEVDSNFTELQNDIGVVNTALVNHEGKTGAVHGVATAVVNGFMSSQDKMNLDGLISGDTSAKIDVTNDVSTATAVYPVFVGTSSTTPVNVLYKSTSRLSYIPETGQLNATSFNSTSDARLKTDVKSIENALSIISAISGKTFKYTETNVESSGVIAQQLQQVLPTAVADRGDGYLSVNYDALIPYLIESVKELQLQIIELQAK